MLFQLKNSYQSLLIAVFNTISLFSVTLHHLRPQQSGLLVMIFALEGRIYNTRTRALIRISIHVPLGRWIHSQIDTSDIDLAVIMGSAIDLIKSYYDGIKSIEFTNTDISEFTALDVVLSIIESIFRQTHAN